MSKTSTSEGGDRVQESALEDLRRSFDERLAALRAPDAGDRLRMLINEPTRRAEW